MISPSCRDEKLQKETSDEDGYDNNTHPQNTKLLINISQTSKIQ